MQSVKGYLLLGSSLVACPCHLPLTLGLLAGTSLGGFMSENLALLALGLSGHFVLALVFGLRWLGRVPARAAAPATGPAHSDGGRTPHHDRAVVATGPSAAARPRRDRA